ncbi:hypothetical protein EPJ69_02595 [Brachyspira aalborgi]|uniref:Uncharacterized protein n=1 Tax=Brachyspira aalborgi TaxID=29522 RepID=A0A5C8FTS8_9SPIR|nr:hypothetical protein [Brachyspira aalborgi]TXJ34211.1 hypothetical protein EPJ69_02595 [Brachyspira aalborgi]TXJ52895.1 hypothetical protein EPJ84_00750 [Brachyspira aalborgi]
MTEQEKQQLREDIKAGKVNIDELYEKYDKNLPYMFTYEERKIKEPNLTIEEYEEDVINDKITILFWQMGWEEF